MRRAGLVACFVLAGGAVQAGELYDGLFVTDPAICARAAETDLSDALFELDGLAIVPRRETLGPEFRCRHVAVAGSAAGAGEDLVVTAFCETLDRHYPDLMSISARSVKAAAARGDRPVGAVIEVVSTHAQAAIGDDHSTLYYRCDAPGPEAMGE